MSKEDEKKNSLTLWEQYKKTITPLKKSKKQEGLDLQKKIEIDIKEHAPQTPSLKAFEEGKRPVSSQGSLQYQSKKKIWKSLQIQGRLDLHGMTQEKAFKALIVFVHRCFTSKKQDLLVITGKGIKLKEGKTEGGVLRRQLPLWLEHPDCRPYVHFYTNSHPFEGGTGAFYIRLRKSSPSKKVPDVVIRS